VQTGRGKLSEGRIRLLGIWRESLQDISGPSAIAEGVVLLPKTLPLEEMIPELREEYHRVAIKLFAELWDRLHPKGKRWEDNPEVWVLEFRLVERTPTPSREP